MVSVRRRVAAHPSTPASALEALAHDRDAFVKEHVAAHAGAPDKVLVMLADSDQKNVRRAVAANESASIEALGLLAADDDARVRELVAANPRSTMKLLVPLSRDENAGVRLNALGNIAYDRDRLLEQAGMAAVGKEAQPSAVAACAPSPADEVRKYFELFQMGALSQEEFDAVKRRLLEV